ncbi:ATP-binding cassette domain-containing protein [Alphaproteobacteria bacterium]|nr:ATP-binding cassette domain-containing protein [Alphaproteobacteria bacterium]
MQKVLELKNVSKIYSETKNITNFLSKNDDKFVAVDNVSFSLEAKKVLGLVGESGSGKSTCALMAMKLLDITEGEIFVNNNNITDLKLQELKKYRKEMQIVFQDSYSSLDPMMTISKIIIEPFIIHKVYSTNERNEIAIDLLEKVGLNKTYTNRYPHELSGGERQRVSIARALALKPSILVADEPTSALDVCVKAQVINLLQDLQDEMGLSILFISHELNVLRSLADKITVMYRGRVVEEAPTEKIFANPIHPYTKSLLEAIPKLDPSLRKRRTFINDSYIQSNIPKYSLHDINFVSKNDSKIGFVEIDNNHFVEAQVV